jgi:chromosome segregation ATPase
MRMQSLELTQLGYSYLQIRNELNSLLADFKRLQVVYESRQTFTPEEQQEIITKSIKVEQLSQRSNQLLTQINAQFQHFKDQQFVELFTQLSINPPQS